MNANHNDVYGDWPRSGPLTAQELSTRAKATQRIIYSAGQVKASMDAYLRDKKFAREAGLTGTEILALEEAVRKGELDGTK